MLWTVGVDGTFRFAFNVWVALQTWVAGARGSLVSICALSIDATWRWSAWVNDLWSWCGGGGSVTAGEWISDVSLVTDTQRDVVPDTAVGVDTT